MVETTEFKGFNILQRLALVQSKVDYIQKEKKQGMRYSIVSHDAVTAKVRPLMVQYGVLYYPVELAQEQVGNRTQAVMKVRFANVDDRSDYIDVVTMGYGIDDQDKGPGKALSYGVKYALLKVLGLESGDDPDEDQDTIHEPTGKDALDLAQFAKAIETATSVENLDIVTKGFSATLIEIATRYPAAVQKAKQLYYQRKAKLE